MALVNAEEYNEIVFLAYTIGALSISVTYYFLYPQTLDIRWSIFLGLIVQTMCCLYFYQIPDQRS